jgi:hypothetical protein
MEDKTLTIVFGSLGATLALVSIAFAYLQLRGFQPAGISDDEEAMPSAHPAGMAQQERATNPPAVVVQEEPVATLSAGVLQKKPVTTPPYASSLATQLYDRADNVKDAMPRIDLLFGIERT